MGALRQAVAIGALPVQVTLVVPTLLVWIGGGPAPAPLAARVASIALGAGGLAMMVWTFRLFATRGHGTLAPWSPTVHLVVAGPYRHCRNPMISGVIALLAGEALALWSPWLAGWCGAFALTNAIYIPLSEEPGLVARFGDAYVAYRENVPRWLPRRTGWSPPEGSS